MSDPTPTTTLELLRQSAEEAWKKVDKTRLGRTLQVAILVALLVCLVLIFLLGAQLRYEGLAAEAFREREYETAAGRYLKALRFATLYGQPRYLYMVGLCYRNQKQPERAGDFFMRLFTTYPDSSWSEAGHAHFERILDEVGPRSEALSAELLKAKTPLGVAFQTMRANQKALVVAIRSVQHGDIRAADLERKYEAYKLAFESYKVEAGKAWAEHRSGASVYEPELGQSADTQTLENTP